MFVSATPGEFERSESRQRIVEQIVRPTGIVDPEVEVRETKNQIDDLMNEIRARVERDERVLVTTLTKKMAEDLTDYLLENGFRVRYLHSEIDTLERIQIIRDLRLGEYDVLVGVNLLREGLDLPEVSLVAILDADKEGFLRGETSLIQTIGRAARNVDGTVLMYADSETDGDARGDRGDRPPPRDPARLQRGARHHAGDASSRGSPTSPSSSATRVRRAAQGPPGGARRSPSAWSRCRPPSSSSSSSSSRRRCSPPPTELRFEYAARLRDELRELRRELDGRAAEAARWRAAVAAAEVDARGRLPRPDATARSTDVERREHAAGRRPRLRAPRRRRSRVAGVGGADAPTLAERAARSAPTASRRQPAAAGDVVERAPCAEVRARS